MARWETKRYEGRANTSARYLAVRSQCIHFNSLFHLDEKDDCGIPQGSHITSLSKPKSERSMRRTPGAPGAFRTANIIPNGNGFEMQTHTNTFSMPTVAKPLNCILALVSCLHAICNIPFLAANGGGALRRQSSQPTHREKQLDQTPATQNKLIWGFIDIWASFRQTRQAFKTYALLNRWVTTCKRARQQNKESLINRELVSV